MKVFPVTVVCLLFTITAQAQDISDVIEWIEEITLEEKDNFWIINPYVSIDPEGGFLVADRDRVCAYTRSGKIKVCFGESGAPGAPGTLQSPDEPVRVSSGHILVPEVTTGNVSVFDSEGNFVKRYPRITQGPVFLRNLPLENKVLVIGLVEVSRGTRPRLLHVFEIEQGRIVQSFFAAPVVLGDYGGLLYTIAPLAVADVRDQTIVAAFALFDELYFFDIQGNFKKKITLSLPHFRKVKQPEKEIESREEWFEFLKTFSTMNDIFWLSEKVILIQYTDSIDLQRRAVRWNLAAVTPQGKLLFDLRDTPRLFAVDGRHGEMFFSHPDYETENYWIVGRLKPEVLRAAGLRP